MRRLVAPGDDVLEFGSGLSTVLFSRHGCSVVALDDHAPWALQVQRLAPEANVIYAPLVEGAYDFSLIPEKPYRLAFVDGPTGDVGREGILDAVDLLQPVSHVVFDDADRESERTLALRTGRALDRPVEFIERLAILSKEG
jgi:predicted nicotinamide N-methyase